MNPSTKFVFFFAISLLFISHASSTGLYQVVCKEAGDQNARCLKFLSTNPQIALAKDYKALCRLVLRLAIDETSKSLRQVQELVKKYPSSQAVKLCATFDYTGTIHSFKSALIEVDEDPETASYDARVAGDGPQHCGDSLAAEKIVDSDFSKLNEYTSFVCNVASLAVDHIY